MKCLAEIWEQTKGWENESDQKKVPQEHFEDVKSRRRNFEILEVAENIQVGDIVVLDEFVLYKGYTGNGIRRKVKYVLYNSVGLKAGYCIVGW